MIKHRTNLNEAMPKRKLVGVEVGVAEGNNSNDMLTNWNIKTLYLVDIWKTTPDQAGDASSPQEWHDSNLANTKLLMKKHGNKAKLLQGMSLDMAKKIKDGTLDFVYLDGDHSYEGCMADLKAWYPKLKKGGLMGGHDFLNHAYGIHKAVHEFAKSEVHTVPEHSPENASFYFVK